EVAQPEVAQPEVAQHEVAQPEVAQPEVAQPGPSQHEVAQPEVAQPEVAQPEVAQPEPIQPDDIAKVVRDAVAATLGGVELRDDLNVTLIEALGLESLDLLDTLFRIESRLPVTLPMSWLSEVLQGDVSDVDFCTANGVITERGMAQLREFMPQLDLARWSGRL